MLLQGVSGITDLITTPGLINLDFADVKSVMSNAGSALMGIGSARGEDRAVAAAEMAVSSPLLEASIDGAHGVLLSIAGGSDLGLFEINEAAALVSQAAHAEANIIFGAIIDDALGDEVRVTVIAAGFDGGMPKRRDEGTVLRREPVAQQTPGRHPSSRPAARLAAGAASTPQRQAAPVGSAPAGRPTAGSPAAPTRQPEPAAASSRPTFERSTEQSRPASQPARAPRPSVRRRRPGRARLPEVAASPGHGPTRRRVFAYQDTLGPVEVAFTDRHGGVSHGPFASLNLATGRGDDDAHGVDEDLEIVATRSPAATRTSSSRCRCPPHPAPGWCRCTRCTAPTSPSSTPTARPSRGAGRRRARHRDAGRGPAWSGSPTASRCCSPTRRPAWSARRTPAAPAWSPASCPAPSRRCASSAPAGSAPGSARTCAVAATRCPSRCAPRSRRWCPSRSPRPRGARPRSTSAPACVAQLTALGVASVDASRCTREDDDLYSYRRQGRESGRLGGLVWVRP